MKKAKMDMRIGRKSKKYERVVRMVQKYNHKQKALRIYPLHLKIPQDKMN